MKEKIIQVESLTGGYDGSIVLKNVTLDVYKGEVLVIVGKSGCGKSTIMRYFLGLQKPYSGRVLFDGTDIWSCPAALNESRKRWGVLFQSGALLGNYTVIENVMLPLKEFTSLTMAEMMDVALSKLEVVGLEHAAFENPLEISGGMQKRAGLARAMVLDPEVLFFDEPSAGLDPVTSAELDNSILSVNRSLGTTLIIVTHELASIFAISDRVVMLDPEEHGIIASGTARDLADSSEDPRVRAFFGRKIGE
ncbi:MAG: ATP-binding cassette domain-containing protein [Candidatus Sabulitectum sp.]|nr:ATP-binding cassette domain-containing protein [Candidatus Sabulitectum sp.]